LFLFNLDRVLTKIPKLPTNLTISTANKPRMDSCLDYKALPIPVTPVSREALMLLLNRVKQVPEDKASS
jgi:hypothetical protein